MRNFSLQVGLTFMLKGQKFRIERIEPDGQTLLKGIENAQLSLVTAEAMLAAFRAGDLSVEEIGSAGSIDASSLPWRRPLTDLPPETRSMLSRRTHYVDWITRISGHVFDAAWLKPVIAEAAEAISDPAPPSPTTCYRWIRKYQSTREVRALIPRFDKRGSRKLRTNEQVLELISEAIGQAYQTTPRPTMSLIQALLLKKISHENAFRREGDQLNAPSKRTLYRCFDRLEIVEKFALKEGQKKAAQVFRITKNGPITSEILERVEVDHTPLDLFLIDDQTWLPLGRPTLTIAIDHFSRMPLGYYLSFGGTSVAAVMGVLRHAILPKEPVAQAIPGLEVHNVWPCFGLIKTLVLDNGMEFHSQDLESVALDLRIVLQFCPTRTPRFKGSVERFLKTINYSFAHQLPGTSLAKFTERGEYDPLKHAVLTLAEFKHAFEKWLLDDYAARIHKGVGTTPLAKWQEGVSRYSPKLPLSISSLQKRIGKVEARSLRHDGVWVNQIRYASESLGAPLRRYGNGVRVRVVYDPDDLGFIQVWAPEEQEPIEVPAVHFEYAKGLTLIQHQMLRDKLREAGKQAEDTKALLEARSALAASISELMSSRKQGKRKLAARIHGKSSQSPDKRFDAAEVAMPSPPAISKMPDSDGPPIVRYPFFTPSFNASVEEGGDHDDLL